jgi:hypothetical protein
MKTKWPKVLVTAFAIAPLFLFVSTSNSNAQGFSSFGQLLGGSNGSHHSSNSDQSGAGVSVQRGAVPFMGTFNGEQKSDSGTLTMDSHFACYPAHDPELAQTQAFVCYSSAPEKSSQE